MRWMGFSYEEREHGEVVISDGWGPTWSIETDEEGHTWARHFRSNVMVSRESKEAALVSAYDELLLTRHGINYTRRPWPKFPPPTPVETIGPKRNGKKVKA